MRPIPRLVGALIALIAPLAIALPGCGPAGATAPGPSLDARCSGTAPLAGLLTVEVRDAAGAPRAGVKVTVRFPSPDEPAPTASAVRALSCSVPRGPEDGYSTVEG